MTRTRTGFVSEGVVVAIVFSIVLFSSSPLGKGRLG
jgi:hypothetical protein